MTDDADTGRVRLDDLPESLVEEGLNAYRQFIQNTACYRHEWWLDENYNELGLTLRQCGVLADVSETTILDWMQRSGMPRRPVGMRQYNHAAYYVHSGGYPAWYVYDPTDQSTTSVLVHRLLIEAVHGPNALAGGKEGHHLNGIKFDNRPSNVVPIGKSEHASIHGKESAERLGWGK